jgi:hypothetical protein
MSLQFTLYDMVIDWYTTSLSNSSNHVRYILTWNCLIYIFHLYCKGLEMMGSDKICTASCTYSHFLSLWHLYPLPFTWRVTNENFQKILFLCISSHNFTPKIYELKYHCCFSQLYFIGC